MRRKGKVHAFWHLSFCAALLLASRAQAQGSPKHALSLEDVVAIRHASDANISPDGKHILFVVAEPADPSTQAAGQAPLRLTKLNPQVDSWQLGTVREITWSNRRDKQLRHGVLVTPSDRETKSVGDGANTAFCPRLGAKKLEFAIDLAQLPKDSEKQNGDYEQQELHAHLDSSVEV